MGRRVNGRFDSLKAWFRRLVVSLLWIASAAVALLTAFTLGGYFFSSDTVEAAPAQVIQAPSPILDRIADCESGTGKIGSGHQYQTDGITPVMHTNTNNTVDVGMYQINQNASNIRIEAQQNFNILTETGNKAMAAYLYANVGTGPWSSSQHCWGK